AQRSHHFVDQMAPDEMGFFGVFWPGLGAAIEKHGAENVLRQITAERRLLPIILGRDGTRSGADFGGKSGPEHDKIEVAAVIGEVNALTFVRFAAGPLHLHAADSARDGGEEVGKRVDSIVHEGERPRTSASAPRARFTIVKSSSTSTSQRTYRTIGTIGKFSPR